MLNGVTLLHKLFCPMLYWLCFNCYINQRCGSNSICKNCWSGVDIIDVVTISEKVLFYVLSESVLKCAEVKMELKSTSNLCNNIYFASVNRGHVKVLVCLFKTKLSTTVKSHCSDFTRPLTLVVEAPETQLLSGQLGQFWAGLEETMMESVHGSQTSLPPSTSWVQCLGPLCADKSVFCVSGQNLD